MYSTTDKGETPLFDAVRSTIKNTDEKISAIKFLLSHGADPGLKNVRGETPLHLAQRAKKKESEEIIKMLE